MSLISEGYSEFVDVTKEKAESLIYKILQNAVLSGEVNPGEYMLIDDDGVYIGEESDFESDVLFYAIPINDVIDFNNVSNGSNFIDTSKIEFDTILSNISN